MVPSPSKRPDEEVAAGIARGEPLPVRVECDRAAQGEGLGVVTDDPRRLSPEGLEPVKEQGVADPDRQEISGEVESRGWGPGGFHRTDELGLAAVEPPPVDHVAAQFLLLAPPVAPEDWKPTEKIVPLSAPNTPHAVSAFSTSRTRSFCQRSVFQTRISVPASDAQPTRRRPSGEKF